MNAAYRPTFGAPVSDGLVSNVRFQRADCPRAPLLFRVVRYAGGPAVRKGPLKFPLYKKGGAEK